MPRVPNADETRNREERHVIGNKSDAAVTTAGTTKSIVAYLKGILSVLSTFIGYFHAVESAGTADIDISESDYTSYQTLLTITPATGYGLADLAIDLDWNKATTGFDKIATANDTLDAVVMSKIDGTNLRRLMNATQVTANGDGSLTDAESGERFHVGPVPVGGTIVVKVSVDTERDDCEIPYRVTYRGAAPTITPVAAG